MIHCSMAYDVKTLLILKIWVMQFRICVMKSYMEKGFILQMMVCKALVLILKVRKEMRMILENMMRRFKHKTILNNMKKEVNMMM